MAATIAAVAGLASAAAAGYGAYSSNQNAAAARRQNALAMDAQRRQFATADEQAASALAPTTNARGDRTEYIPGVGWVETASPLTRALQVRSDTEEAARLAEDMPRARMTRENAFRTQQGERGLANAALARSNIGTRSLEDVEADAIRLGVARAAAPRQALDNAAVITALRQGSGAQDLLAQTGRGVGKDTRIALEEARAGAPRGFADAESARSNDAINRYNTLMTRANAPDGVTFTPNTLMDTLTASRSKQQGTAAYGLASAMGVRPFPVQAVDDLVAKRLESGINAGEKGIRSLDTLLGGDGKGSGFGSAWDDSKVWLKNKQQLYLQNPNAPVTDNSANYAGANDTFYSSDYIGKKGTDW